MSKVEIYEKPSCPYCRHAKHLLRQRGIQFVTIDVSSSPCLREEMMRRAKSAWTVPQIFIGDVHVGGCEDLYELDHQGSLASLLQAE